MKTSKLPTVGFRLSPAQYEQLEKVAFKAGISVHEAARGLVAEALTDQSADQLKQRIEGLDNKVTNLSTSLANAIEALLVLSGEVKKDEAKVWVNENMR